MVHIKKVEIFGFKSFPFRNTIVNFEPGLVSISGANGSGKSNILDAIIFATGETRPTVMRASKMTGLLHTDEDATAGRDDTVRRRTKAHLMARVVLHFDNKDRSIPVALDSISIARELDASGENSYYLNGKQTSRTHISELLDVIHVGQDYLNVVQQHLVTKIAEYSPVKIRESISDLIGITAFDAKIEQARSELDLADHKLEVAVASMTQVKRRIEELEEERNIKMRHDLILADLARYEALHAREQLQSLSLEKASKEANLSNLTSEIEDLKSSIEDMRSESEQLKGERDKAMDAESAYRQAKADLDSQLNKHTNDYDDAFRRINIAESRISQIDTSLKALEKTRSNTSASTKYLGARVRENEDLLEAEESKRDEIRGQLADIDAQLSGMIKAQSDAAARVASLESKIGRLGNDKSSATYKKMASEQDRKNALAGIEQASDKLSANRQSLDSLEKSAAGLQSVIERSSAAISSQESKIRTIAEMKRRHVSDLASLEHILKESDKAAVKYSSKIKVVKGFMHEDYSTAKLKEDARSLGIEGLVYEMMTWDSEYERPILAASSDWIKSMVVRNFDDMMGISESALSKKLPKFKLIPLNVVSNLKVDSPPPVIGGIDTMGALADYVRCDAKYDSLRNFLFGGVVLVGSRESAISVSKLGYRAVSMSGEYFEARGSAVVVDINSKISKITRLISMSGDVDGLVRSISLVKRYIKKKERAVQRCSDDIQSCRGKIDASRSRAQSAEEHLRIIRPRLDILRNAIDALPSKISEMRQTVEVADADIASCESRIRAIDHELALANEECTSVSQAEVGERLSAANDAKVSLVAKESEATTRCNRVTADLSGMRGSLRSLMSQDQNDSVTEGNLRKERDGHVASISQLTPKKESAHERIAELRQREQELISTSGSSTAAIREYNTRIDGLAEREKEASSGRSKLLRKSDSLRHDLSLMESREEALRRVASSVPNEPSAAAGYPAPPRDSGMRDADRGGAEDGMLKGGDADSHLDVGSIVAELRAELESLPELNSNAPSKYAEIAGGYRLQSVRRNSLESERNSIVQFIKRIERDRKQTFLDAFDIVNEEIRSAFGKMTGGRAWLELQDEDNIFDSGVSYMVQFADKPVRSSYSISGGEKSLAAVVFVLALQKLQPSPFYLFDEVDAALDAVYAKTLSAILAERARDSQFIIVSLKDTMVEKAGLAHGVFPRGGVSHVVQYKRGELLAKTPRPADGA